jgi:hypothetical protein
VSNDDNRRHLWLAGKAALIGCAIGIPPEYLLYARIGSRGIPEAVGTFASYLAFPGFIAGMFLGGNVHTLQLVSVGAMNAVFYGLIAYGVLRLLERRRRNRPMKSDLAANERQ